MGKREKQCYNNNQDSGTDGSDIPAIGVNEGPDCNGTISRQGDRLMLGEERKEHTITDWEIQFQLDPNFEIIRFPEGLVRELGYESLEKLFYFAGTSLLFSLTSEDIAILPAIS